MALLYWITDDVSKDIRKYGYVGITTKTIKQRLYRHKYDCQQYVKTGKSSCIKLYNKVNKLGGWNNVVCITLCESTTDYCLMMESVLRQEENIGWNICIGGKQPGMLHKKTKSSTKEKLRIVRSKWVMSKETREKLSVDRKNNGNPMFGTLPWCNPATNNISIQTWFFADRLYEEWLSNEKCGVRVLSKSFPELNYWTIDSIIRKFKTGWKPIEDDNWNNFKKDEKWLLKQNVN